MQANFTEGTMKFFWMPNLKIYWFAKNFLRNSSQLVHMVVRELLRLSDGLANRSFCRSDIWRVQLKSSGTVGERLLASDQSQFDNAGWFYLNAMRFSTMPNLNIYSFLKNFTWKSSPLAHMVLKELLRLSDGLANRLFCRSNISRVQPKSNWTVGERLLALTVKFYLKDNELLYSVSRLRVITTVVWCK